MPGLYFRWELRFPLVPVMIVPYLSEDVFFFFSPFLCRTNDELRRHGSRLLLAVNIAAVFFLLFPLHIGWPREPVSGANGLLFSLLRALDRPYNLVPSLHLAILVLLWVVYCRRVRGLLRIAIQFWFVLIGVSTVLTRQHHLVDVVTGLMLGWLCLYVVPDRRTARLTWERNWVVGLAYGVGAATCLAAASLFGPAGLVLIWPGISLGIVAAGYLFLGPVIFRKQDGRVPLRIWLVHWPYLIGVRIAARLRRYPGPSQISTGVWVGGWPNARVTKELLKAGVTAVLDLTSEFTELPVLRRQVCYRNIAVLDLTAPSQEQLSEAVRFVEEESSKGVVYVHCAVGYSRSICVIAAWLLGSGRAQTAKEAVAQTRAARPRAVAGAGQLRALRAFEPAGAIDRQQRSAS